MYVLYSVTVPECLGDPELVGELLPVLDRP